MRSIQYSTTVVHVALHVGNRAARWRWRPSDSRAAVGAVSAEAAIRKLGSGSAIVANTIGGDGARLRAHPPVVDFRILPRRSARLVRPGWIIAFTGSASLHPPKAHSALSGEHPGRFAIRREARDAEVLRVILLAVWRTPNQPTSTSGERISLGGATLGQHFLIAVAFHMGEPNLA